MAVSLKKDRYLKERGGAAKLVSVLCAKCGERVLLYQKDGPGWLKRCYLNRIFEPEEYSKLQHDKKHRKVEELPKLLCQNCKSVIGFPTRYKDGRIAYALIRSSFKRKTLRTL